METAHLFPRTWDNGTERNQEGMYRNFGGLEQGEEPNTATDIKYFMSYQFRWMYWRYFMWNFAGKQNDLQGFGNIRDGNWQSGIHFIDNNIFGISTDQELPDTAGKENKANNKIVLPAIPVGYSWFCTSIHAHTPRFPINFLLFFFTGFAIVIYLNQAGQQPRERDYAYVGSFYAFAIWIGLGVIWVRECLSKFMKGNLCNSSYMRICVPCWQCRY